MGRADLPSVKAAHEAEVTALQNDDVVAARVAKAIERVWAHTPTIEWLALCYNESLVAEAERERGDVLTFYERRNHPLLGTCEIWWPVYLGKLRDPDYPLVASLANAFDNAFNQAVARANERAYDIINERT